MIDFYAIYRKIPGGLLLIPMFLVAIINTIFPEALANSGSMTKATFKTGTLCLAGVILFATGASIQLKTLPETLKRSGTLTVVKLALSFGAGYAFMYLFGLNGIFGISAVAFITCIASCNPGVYMGLIQDYGEPADLGNFAMLNLLASPAIPILIIGTSSGMGFDVMEVITVFIPLILGMIMGNLDPKLSKLYGAVAPTCLPFLGCCFGASLNLVTAAKAGVAGIILSVLYILVNIPILLLTDKLINRRPGYASVATCSVAGIALVIPFMLGDAYKEYIATSVSQIALCLVITSIISPFITKWVVSKWGAPRILAKMGPGGPGAPAPKPADAKPA